MLTCSPSVLPSQIIPPPSLLSPPPGPQRLVDYLHVPDKPFHVAVASGPAGDCEDITKQALLLTRQLWAQAHVEVHYLWCCVPGGNTLGNTAGNTSCPPSLTSLTSHQSKPAAMIESLDDWRCVHQNVERVGSPPFSAAPAASLMAHRGCAHSEDTHPHPREVPGTQDCMNRYCGLPLGRQAQD